MSSKTFSRTFGVGSRYTATLTVPAPIKGALLDATVQWHPRVPRRLSASERKAYERGLTRAIEAVSAVVTDVANEHRLRLEPDPTQVVVGNVTVQ